MRSNKAQFSIGQVFVYILAIVVAGLIILYGYRAIAGFKGQAEDIALVNFKTSIENDIESMATRFDSVRTQEYDVPGDEVCFVDMDKKGDVDNADLCISGSEDYNALICNSWKAGANQNIFLIPMADVQIYAESLRVNGTGYFCTEAKQGRITIRLEGKGDSTLVSEVQ